MKKYTQACNILLAFTISPNLSYKKNHETSGGEEKSAKTMSFHAAGIFLRSQLGMTKIAQPRTPKIPLCSCKWYICVIF